MARLEQLGISIGNIPLYLHVAEPNLHEKAGERYAWFLRDGVDALRMNGKATLGRRLNSLVQISTPYKLRGNSERGN